MSFTPEWLALREPADHAARSASVTHAALEASRRAKSLSILDLGAGTGSNLRYLRRALERAGGSADVLLVDHDSDLLARVPKAAGVTTRCLDLATLNDPSIFAGQALVTASALLDLVSESWLRALAERCAEAGAAALFALTYDGRIVCSPEDPDDRAVIARVNEHQRTDKGFGPALGPDASDCAERCFRDRGYQVLRDRSDWVLTAVSSELQRQLVDGWASAALEIAPSDTAMIDAWRHRRRAHIEAGRSSLVVGHEDLAAIVESRDFRI